MSNPKRALAAFNAPAFVEVAGHRVYEITLGMAGILEAIGSPLSTGVMPETVMGWAATLYAMTRPPGESRAKLAAMGAENHAAEADAWADTLPAAEASALIRAVGAANARSRGIDPETDEEDTTAAGDGAAANPTAAGPTAG